MKKKTIVIIILFFVAAGQWQESPLEDFMSSSTVLILVFIWWMIIGWGGKFCYTDYYIKQNNPKKAWGWFLTTVVMGIYSSYVCIQNEAVKTAAKVVDPLTGF